MQAAEHPVSMLIWMTFGVVIIGAIVLLLTFLRKRRNRHPMAGQPERNINEIRRDAGDPPR